MRLDVYLTEHGYAPSRQRAKVLIEGGMVVVDGKTVTKPSQAVTDGEHTVTVTDDLPYVGRGGLKLEAALDAFAVSPNGLFALDIGASTGGFTDCLLQRGAASVCAVDAGAGQLAEKLIHRGVSRENAEAAVAELIEKGYIDEEKDIMRLCDSMISKKYGPRKILVALRGRGYGREALAVAEEYLSDTDFSVVCESLIATKIKKIPENRDEMKKLIAKLTALGYNVSDVKKALSRSFGEE